MAFLAGDTLKAQRINRLQPKSYRAGQTSPLAGPAAMADVPGCSITLTTETAGAVFVAECEYDFEVTTSNGGLSSGNLNVDGATQTEFAVFRWNNTSTNVNNRATTPATYRGTLSAAGSHTLKLVASPSTGHRLFAYSALTVTIYEVA
ncbi:hypothetical protein ACWCPF_05540 [Streptomyces sp. NPDC001858]